MTELSVTVTFGIGSECHNHDLDYRDALEHVTSRPDGVVELIPYRPYNIVINEYMKPYIDAYNAKVGERYEAALQRHKVG